MILIKIFVGCSDYVAVTHNTINEEMMMHTADLKEDKAMGKRVGITVAVLFGVMIVLIIASNMIG